MKKTLYLFIVLIVFATVAGAKAEFTPTLCWSFDDNTGTQIKENCLGDGSYNITTIKSDYNSSGRIGGGRNYVRANADGDAVAIPGTLSIVGNSITFGCWVNRNLADGVNNIDFIGTGYNDGAGDQWSIGQNTDHTMVTRQSTGAGAFSGAAPGNGVWQHIVGVYDGTTQYMYVNGTLRGTQALAFTLDTDLKINLGNNSNPSYFDGMLDECFYYAGNISSRNVSEIYNRTNPWGYVNTIFSITSGSILTLNATINGTTYSTTNGTISTGLSVTSGAIYNITISGECGGGFCNYSTENYLNYNISSNLNANLAYWYSVQNYSVSTTFELSEQTASLQINHSTDKFSHSISNVSAVFFWNGTQQTLNKYSFSNYTVFNVTFVNPSVITSSNVTLLWRYNITRTAISTQTINANNTFTQQIYFIVIDNCSTYSTVAYNFSIYNITNRERIISVASANFQVWVADINNYKNFNLTWTNTSSFGVCIYPAALTSYIYAQMIYTPNTLSPHTYYLINATFNNITVNVPIYVSSSAVPVLMTFTDQYSYPVADAYVFIQHYEIGTNSAITDQIIKTDPNGQAIGQIILLNQYYKIIVIKNNEVLYSSNPFLFFENTKTFTVGSSTPSLSSFEYINNIQDSLTYTQSGNTTTFSYTFVDTTGTTQQACLNVYSKTGLARTNIGTSCLTSASGTINTAVNTTSLTNGVVTGEITLYTSDRSYAGGSVSVQVNNIWLVLLRQAGLMMFLLFLAIIGANALNPTTAILGSAAVTGLLIWAGALNLAWGGLTLLFIIVGGIVLITINP